MISILSFHFLLILSLSILLPATSASERMVVTLDPQTNAALLRYRYRIECSLTTGAMEAATQELYTTLGVKPEDEEAEKTNAPKPKKRAARKVASESS